MPDAPFDSEQLAVILEHLREGLQVVGPDWRYVYVNHAAAAQGRTTPGALIGRTMTDCYPGIDATPMFQMLRRVMATGRPETMTNEFSFPDGGTGWFELRVEQVPLGLAILSIDVTAQRTLERNLRQAMRTEALGRLAGGLAHDFNNLLTVITSYTSFLIESNPGPEFLADLKPIAEAADRAARLTGELLAFARRKPVTPVRLDAVKVVGEVVGLSQRLLGEGIRVERGGAVGLPSVYMDPGALEQVVLNLVLNARDAMGGVGRLVVETRQVELVTDQEWSRGEAVPPGTYVVISVTDTGTGMTPEILENLFDPFFSTKGERGTGLGLSSSYGLVRQAGGYISVYSEPGRGATFRVYLPGMDETPADTAPPTARAEAGHELVLVVDDDDAVLKVTLRSLGRYGYQVHGCSTFAEGIESLRGGLRPELLLTDVRLAAESGTALAAEARLLIPGLRILLMSGFSASALPPGSNDELIEKPFSPKQLAERVRALLDRPRA